MNNAIWITRLDQGALYSDRLTRLAMLLVNCVGVVLLAACGNGESASSGAAATPGPSLVIPAKIIGPQPVSSTDMARATLFASPTGTGGTCSKLAPCDIWVAAAKASGGDVVFLRGGTYAITKSLYFNVKATAVAPIIVESYPGESAVLDGSSLLPKGTDVGVRLYGSFYNLRLLTVQNMPMQGIYIGGTDNILDGVQAQGNALSGIQIYSPYTDFPYGTYGSRNIIRNCTVSENSDAGLSGGEFADGGNADGISISSGTDNRVENCLVFHNSDDGIDTWRSTNSYVGYSISHSNGIAAGNGNGIKAGGPAPSRGTFVEHCLSYSNKSTGLTFNTGVNVRFINNTTWNNRDHYSYSLGSDTIVTRNISAEATQWGNGIADNNSWQRSGSVDFIGTDPNAKNFLVPTVGGGFEDIGAYQFP